MIRFIFTFLFFIWLSPVLACTCIGKGVSKIQEKVRSSVLVVHGVIITAEVYDYLDSSKRFINENGDVEFYRGKEKMYTLVIEDAFKMPFRTPDTIQIITGFGGGDCGYEFEIGKKYIVYGRFWKEGNSKFESTVIPGKFWTDICTYTQESNTEELTKLKTIGKQPHQKYDLRLVIDSYEDTIFGLNDLVIKFKLVNDGDSSLIVKGLLENFLVQIRNPTSRMIVKAVGQYYVITKSVFKDNLLTPKSYYEFEIGINMKPYRKIVPGFLRLKIDYLISRLYPEFKNPSSEWIEIYLPKYKK